ncbi:phospholipase D1 isoform X2 [Hydra vulgaris]|uniref:phospholipase D1 isoform X2 n=1 Tax=Hydra vulgaris TaxID=6087 RepID=UPI001F5EAE63|nr:phospholipase D1 isoform X2 [Hydra vulgaris]
MDKPKDIGYQVSGKKNEVVNDEKPDVQKNLVIALSSSSLSSESSASDEDFNQNNQDEIDYADVTKSILTSNSQPGQSWNYFLPGVPVRIIINEFLFQPLSHRMNPNLYIIKVQHGEFKWLLRRRYNHFRALHTHLELSYAALLVQHPNLASRREKVPKFPHRPDILISSNKKEKRMKKLQRFLQKVVDDDKLRCDRHTLDFLEVCHLSFIKDIGMKSREGEVFKKAGGHTFSKSLIGRMKLNTIWNKRWMVVKDSFLTYIDKENHKVRDVMLFDKNFTVTCDKDRTGIGHGLLISNNSRNLLIKCVSSRQSTEWMNEIVQKMGGVGSDWIRNHHNDSFAPLRRNSWGKWFIDGSDYFKEVADAISKAKEEIYIADWWLSPELILKRPITHPEKWRLDMLLKERASKGVQIYILLYKEIEMTLPINSLYTKKTLLSLHENIKVLRHPDHISAGNATLFWAHHEKIVCIDQKICFLGGLDLCFGRWDDSFHRITDFGSATPSFKRKNDNVIRNSSDLNCFTQSYNSMQQIAVTNFAGAKNFIGKDYSNPYVKDITEVDKPFTDSINRNLIPRMPWHDIGALFIGSPAQDVARHFIQRWNLTKHEKAKEDLSIPFLLPKSLISEKDPERFSDLINCDVQILRSCSLWSTGDRVEECSIYTAYLELIKNSKYYIYIENQFFISSLPEDNVFNKIADVLVERILYAYYNKEVFRVYILMPLLPCFPGEIGTSSATSMLYVESWNLKSCNKVINRLKAAGVHDPSPYISFYSLRSYANLAGKLVSVPVYIHSKLLIVDDSVAVIGSANINDRSMLGSRDSEIGVCIQDYKFIDGIMNGLKVKVGQFASSLRKKLFQEHLGLLNQPVGNVLDPISDHFYNKTWKQRAVNNSEIYEKKNSMCEIDSEQAELLLKDILGFLVIKPLNFLCNQNLTPAAGTNEALVPAKVFT